MSAPGKYMGLYQEGGVRQHYAARAAGIDILTEAWTPSGWSATDRHIIAHDVELAAQVAAKASYDQVLGLLARSWREVLRMRHALSLEAAIDVEWSEVEPGTVVVQLVGEPS